MPGRAYTSGQASRYQTARDLARRQQEQAVANRCRGRRKSTASNPLPHVYKPIVGGDLMGCKHCPAVRQLNAVEYRAKYGVDRPPPRPQQRDRGIASWLPLVIVPAIVWAGASGSTPVILATGLGMVLALLLWVRR